MDRNRPLKFQIIHFLLLIAVAFFSCHGPAEDTTEETVNRIRVRTANYEKQDFALTERFSGEVKPLNQVNLSFNIPGKIERFYFDEGDAVKKGQLLAQLEQQDYKTVRDQSLAQWEKAKRDFERSQRLWKEGTIQEQIVQDAETGFKAAQAVLEAADLNLEHCQMVAPFSGHVAFRFGEERELAAPGQVVFTLMDLSHVLVELGASERSVGQLKEGQTAALVIQSLQEEPRTGRVSHVAVSAFPDSRLFKVEIEINNPNLDLKPGMTASVGVIIDTISDAFVFSIDASVLRKGERVVFFLEREKAVMVVL
ncbi:MAG: efflux RND transporter periplasmic adaptor subunit, partial [Candidatus Aminicenantes bacterium]|nr:efflux RND transporter periplasmic adaptor subunit [Candidatus Aminicenantes bacterium]